MTTAKSRLVHRILRIRKGGRLLQITLWCRLDQAVGDMTGRRHKATDQIGVVRITGLSDKIGACLVRIVATGKVLNNLLLGFRLEDGDLFLSLVLRCQVLVRAQ